MTNFAKILRRQSAGGHFDGLFSQWGGTRQWLRALCPYGGDPTESCEQSC